MRIVTEHVERLEGLDAHRGTRRAAVGARRP
jgi:hypothetical protein